MYTATEEQDSEAAMHGAIFVEKKAYGGTKCCCYVVNVSDVALDKVNKVMDRQYDFYRKKHTV